MAAPLRRRAKADRGVDCCAENTKIPLRGRAFFPVFCATRRQIEEIIAYV